MDPRMPTEILDLASDETKPNLRPRYIVGSPCKLWGLYPAWWMARARKFAGGMAYNVQKVEDAEKHEAYETGNYRVKPCFVTFTEGKEPGTTFGNTFAFAGDPRELGEGAV